jgi:hypothetical protein
MSVETPEQTGPQTGQESPQEPTETASATPRKKTPDTSTVSLDGINAATLAIPDLIAAAAPMRERKEQQKAMDKVAARAYAAWVKAGRPSVWNKMPVITYFLDEDDVPKYKFLIRRACAIVEPEGDAPGVRVRFGNEFTLPETMAAKMKDAEHPEGRPDLAGKHVLAWAAVDKRAVEDGSKTAAQTDAKVDDAATDDGKRPGQRGRGSKK